MDKKWERELFLNRMFEANSFKVKDVSLGSSVDDIDYYDIVAVYVNKKGYETLRFIDRIELMKKGRGWIHCASGASFEIKKGIVIQIKLTTRYLQDNESDRDDLIKIFGEPDIELVDDIFYSGIDYNIDHYVLVYRKKKIYAFIDPITNKLKELHFGEFDEKAYGKRLS
jgi:hypothetical protein